MLEDDTKLASLIARCVQPLGLNAVVCESLAEAVRQLDAHEFAVVLMDEQLPDGKGSRLFERLDAMGLSAPRIMFTAFPDVARAVQLTRGGLFDYLTKPFDLDTLSHTVARALRHSMARQPQTPLSFTGVSSAARRVRELIRLAAAAPTATVLITGETGTGKELTTRLIHDATIEDRKPAPPLVALDCSAVPAELFESELFGAEKGAYTGAHQPRMGLAEAAGTGTLFLDEIGELPLPLQAKLLRFIESREFRRIGSTTTLPFRGRLVAATNRELPKWVSEGHFRSDLYYRLNVFEIPLAPLRERREDIPMIAEETLARLAARHERPKPILRDEHLAWLRAQEFPGNVRELRNLLERSLIQTAPQSHWLHLEVPHAAMQSVSARIAPMNGGTLEDTERALLRQTLENENYNISRAARCLGLSRQAVLRRLEKWPELKRPN